VYTAPYHGFGTAANYYHQASAMRVAGDISIPALILAAQDDPFVPAEQFAMAEVAQNPCIDVRISRHGGHCGFVAEHTATSDGYWAESTAIDFLDRLR
jgi:predicted alpha/beta-fold hydrolase